MLEIAASSKLRDLIARGNSTRLLVTSHPQRLLSDGLHGLHRRRDRHSGTTAIVLVDPRYTVQARAECTGFTVVEYVGKSTIAAAAELINELAVAEPWL